MAKQSPVDLLNSQRVELTNTLADLESRRARLTEVIRKPLPEWNESASARAIAQAELQDRMHGTDNAASVAAQEAKRRQEYGKAYSERTDAETALQSLDIQREVYAEELQRITQEIDSISTARAEKEFHAARAKLLDMAQALRDQAVITAAWGQLADADPRITPIRVPGFDAETFPAGFWDSGRHYLEFGKLEMQFAADNKAQELREAA